MYFLALVAPLAAQELDPDEAAASASPLSIQTRYKGSYQHGKDKPDFKVSGSAVKSLFKNAGSTTVKATASLTIIPAPMGSEQMPGEVHKVQVLVYENGGWRDADCSLTRSDLDGGEMNCVNLEIRAGVSVAVLCHTGGACYWDVTAETP